MSVCTKRWFALTLLCWVYHQTNAAGYDTAHTHTNTNSKLKLTLAITHMANATATRTTTTTNATKKKSCIHTHTHKHAQERTHAQDYTHFNHVLSLYMRTMTPPMRGCVIDNVLMSCRDNTRLVLLRAREEWVRGMCECVGVCVLWRSMFVTSQITRKHTQATRDTADVSCAKGCSTRSSLQKSGFCVWTSE